MNCPHCERPLFKLNPDGSKLKAPTSCLVLHKSGDVEINCKRCKRGVIVPLMAIPGKPELRKAANPPLVFRNRRKK